MAPLHDLSDKEEANGRSLGAPRKTRGEDVVVHVARANAPKDAQPHRLDSRYKFWVTPVKRLHFRARGKYSRALLRQLRKERGVGPVRAIKPPA